MDLQREYRYAHIDNDKLLLWIKDGKSKEEIASLLNISLTSLFRYVKLTFNSNIRTLRTIQIKGDENGS